MLRSLACVVCSSECFSGTDVHKLWNPANGDDASAKVLSTIVLRRRPAKNCMLDATA